MGCDSIGLLAAIDVLRPWFFYDKNPCTRHGIGFKEVENEMLNDTKGFFFSQRYIALRKLTPKNSHFSLMQLKREPKNRFYGYVHS